MNEGQVQAQILIFIDISYFYSVYEGLDRYKVDQKKK